MSPDLSQLHATYWKSSTVSLSAAYMISGYEVSYLAQYQSLFPTDWVRKLARGAPDPMPAVYESPTAAKRLTS